MRHLSRVLTAGAALALAATVAAEPAAAALHHHARMMTVHRTARPMLIPAVQRATFHGAPGFAGTPGPVAPTLVDFPASGFFTPAGFIDYGTGIGTGLITGIPGAVTGAVDLGTGLATTAVGAGTGIVGAGVGYLPR